MAKCNQLTSLPFKGLKPKFMCGLIGSDGPWIVHD